MVVMHVGIDYGDLGGRVGASTNRGCAYDSGGDAAGGEAGRSSRAHSQAGCDCAAWKAGTGGDGGGGDWSVQTIHYTMYLCVFVEKRTVSFFGFSGLFFFCDACVAARRYPSGLFIFFYFFR